MSARVGVSIAPVGRAPDGTELLAATITSPSGMRMRVLDLGGIIQSLEVPDAGGGLRDVVLGFDDAAAYLDDRFYLGALVGRYAGRIAGARFPLDGAIVHVSANQGTEHLHGGFRGFGKARWTLAPYTPPGAQGVTLDLTSPDGDEGFPGALRVRAAYALTDDGALEVAFIAQSDRPTPVNLTQHSYFNLAGHGTVLDHTLRVEADRYLPLDARQIPTGKFAHVAGTAFDARVERPLRALLAAEPLASESLDHSFILREPEDDLPALRPAATLASAESGITLTVSTTEPSVHCYAARYLVDVVGKGQARYGPHSALCLETQHFPDSPNRDHFPSTIVRPSTLYQTRTRFAFASPGLSRRSPAG